MASYYADPFHDGPTSSGKKYDKHALKVTGKEFPYGTTLEVTDIVTGKIVRVRVNDCGPNCERAAWSRDPATTPY